MRRHRRRSRSTARRAASGDSSVAAGPVTVDARERGAALDPLPATSRCCAASPFSCATATWNTAAAIIGDLRVDRAGAGGFRRRPSRRCCRTADGDLPWQARDHRRRGRHGPLRRRSHRRPPTSCTNRTGFVVLHPLDGVVGEPVVVTHVDGREQRARFPILRRSRAVLHRCAGHAPSRDRRRLGDLHDGGRRLGDRGSSQLARCVLQDLCPPAAAAPIPTRCRPADLSPGGDGRLLRRCRR